MPIINIFTSHFFFLSLSKIFLYLKGWWDWMFCLVTRVECHICKKTIWCRVNFVYKNFGYLAIFSILPYLHLACHNTDCSNSCSNISANGTGSESMVVVKWYWFFQMWTSNRDVLYWDNIVKFLTPMEELFTFKVWISYRFQMWVTGRSILGHPNMPVQRWVSLTCLDCKAIGILLCFILSNMTLKRYNSHSLFSAVENQF